MQQSFEGNEENNEEDNEEERDKLRMENEIKKIKIDLEHGTDLSKQLSESELPPEIEGEFLDYIQQFEEQFAKRETILVFDLAGKPEYRQVNDIPDEEIAGELDRIMQILQTHSINLNTLCDVDERELYRFITEELFKEETNDIRIPGMIHGFIYEEFHPNHQYDIKNRITELVEYLFDKEKENASDAWELADEIEVAGQTLAKKDFLEKSGHFRDAFSSFTTHEFAINNILVNEPADEGHAQCTLHYSGNIEGSPESLEFEGACQFYLRRQYDWWTIYKLEIPGLVL